MQAKNDLPEGTLRSAFLPLEVRNGTKLFLTYKNGWYRIHTRFENFKKFRSLEQAGAYYDGILDGSVEL